MNEEKGILDDIEELVGDFQKKKPSHKKLSTLEFVEKFVNMDKSLTDFQKYYLDHLDKQQESELDYNKKIPYNCRCGIKYIVYIYQEEGMANYMRNVHDFDTYENCYEKRFYCMKCGALSCITMHSPFEIVLIKHDTNFKI